MALLDSGLPNGTQNSPYNEMEIGEGELLAAVRAEYGTEAAENMRAALAEGTREGE